MNFIKIFYMICFNFCLLSFFPKNIYHYFYLLLKKSYLLDLLFEACLKRFKNYLVIHFYIYKIKNII